MKKLRKPRIENPELVATDATNPIDNIEAEKQLLSSYDETNQKKGRLYEIQLLASYETIAGHQKNTFRVLRYFYEKGCSFGKDIEHSLGINDATAFRIIEKLASAGFIEPLTKMRGIPRRAGKKTTLYGVPDVTREEVDGAIAQSMRYSSKSYAFVEQLYQRTLPEIERESIQYLKIVSIAKRQGGSAGYHFMDIATQVARMHASKGIKVWR